MDIALKDKTLLIEKEAFEIRKILNSLDIRFINGAFHIIDKRDIDDLKFQSEKEQKSSWKKSNFKNGIVINSKEKINLDSIKVITNSLDKKQKKIFIKEIKKYNANDAFYRSFPLKVSKPIYSSDEKLAIIGFSRGNSGGEIVLYKLVDEKWIAKSTLEKWAY